jgi:inositol oxygenase
LFVVHWQHQGSRKAAIAGQAIRAHNLVLGASPWDTALITPLSGGVDEWDDFVATRYRQGKSEEEFRNYEADANPTVTEFYRQNHARQTLDFVLSKKAEYCSLNRDKKGIWEMAEYLNTLVDDSDPDTDLTQIEHLLQTAEAIRKDGHPRWFILAGFVHDLGKVLCLYGEPQWAVVGDTFPVACRYSDQVVFPEFFAANPDCKIPGYQTQYGIYEPNCGLDKVHLSFGHDEYIYQATRRYLPEEAQSLLSELAENSALTYPE